MYQHLLSALLLGMLPPTSLLLPQAATLQIAIAPPAAPVQVGTHLSASGVVILDAQSGQQLYAQQADVKRPMASLTKLMTALIIIENHDLDEVVRTPPDVASVPGSRAYLPPNERFTVGSLLSALLIASGNDAAVTLAQFHSGSTEAFVEEMNRRAGTMGLQSTSFANPTGMDSVNQWSTPRDIAWLAAAALGHEEIESRLGRPGGQVWSVEGTPVLLTHTHALLHDPDLPIRAGKTGTTVAAGECLMSLVKEGGRSYIVVLLNSLQRYVDMLAILDSLDPAQHMVSQTLSSR